MNAGNTSLKAKCRCLEGETLERTIQIWAKAQSASTEKNRKGFVNRVKKKEADPVRQNEGTWVEGADQAGSQAGNGSLLLCCSLPAYEVVFIEINQVQDSRNRLDILAVLQPSYFLFSWYMFSTTYPPVSKLVTLSVIQTFLTLMPLEALLALLSHYTVCHYTESY